MRQQALIASAILLAGCSQAPDRAGQEPAATTVAKAAAAPSSDASAIRVSIPQIAYTYRFGFRLPGRAVATTQDRHIAMCDQLGLTRCRVLDMQRGAGEGESAGGTLKLMVRADLARQFGRALSAAASQAGGTQAESSIAAEDLSKQIVDTDARLRAKQALSDRLTELLRTRSGPVADLVAAERSVAAVQEEIDATQSWLAEARGRVAMSTFELSYTSDDVGGGFSAPLRASTRAMGALFGQSLAALIQLLALLLPWLIVGAGVLAVVRYVRRRRARAEVE